MSSMSRRLFIGGSAATAAAAGLTAVAGRAAADEGQVSVGDAQVLVFVRDAGAGEVVFLGDDAESMVTDRELAAGLVRAQRKAGV